MRRVLRCTSDSTISDKSSTEFAEKSTIEVIEKSDVKSDAKIPLDAKSDAEPASTKQHEAPKNQQKKHRREPESLTDANEWTVLDLNQRPQRCQRGALAN